jgi:hypothetical protein
MACKCCRVQSSEFRKYETIAYFTSGQAFRWFAQLDWNPVSYNYPYFTTVSSVFENANDGDSNLKVAGASGWYRVAVDLGAKTVTATAVDEPVMYMTGAGIGGWDQPGTGASIKMTYIKQVYFKQMLILYRVLTGDSLVRQTGARFHITIHSLLVYPIILEMPMMEIQTSVYLVNLAQKGYGGYK